MDSTQTKKLFEMLPLLAFVAAYFVFHLFEWQEVTCAIWAALVSLLTFLFLAADLRMEHKKALNWRQLEYYSAALSFLFLLIFAQGFIHWNRMLTFYWRAAIFVLLLLIYFIVLFRAIRIFLYMRDMIQTLEQSGKTKK